MQTNVRLGRIAGVEVGLNWSWLVAAVLIVWVLAAGVFPDSNPGHSDGTYLAMAVAAATAFFASLLLHELGHAVQAQREGMEIDGITLWVFGGVARFKGSFPSAGAELRIALAGPAVSLALGVGFVAVALVAPLPEAVDAVVFWLGYSNLVLLVFNLLPALPLDGGRVLRAFLWKRSGDFGRATRVAAAIGRGFGQLLIGFGLVVAIFGGAFSGIWLAFIGWFLLMAAEAEAETAAARGVLRGLRVADVMVRDPVVADPRQTLERFIDDVVLRHRYMAYPVVDDEARPVGVISFRDVLRVPRTEWPLHRVEEYMTPAERALIVTPDADLGEVVLELVQTEPRRALVLEDGRLAGLLSVTDALRVLEVERARTAESGRVPARATRHRPVATGR